MIALVRTELLKLYWTRATWGILTFALILVLVRVQLLLAGVGQVGGPRSGSSELALAVLGTSGIGVFVIVLLGVLTITREFHHATWTSTLLTTPDRRRLVLAKVLAAALSGVVLATLLFAVTAALGLLSGEVRFVLDTGLVRFVVGGLVSAACWAWLGVAVGVLVRQQMAALLVPLVWMLVVEPLLSSFGFGVLLPWTPGGATRTLAGDSFTGALPVWVAVVVLAAYAVGLTALGTRRLVRSDVC